MITDEDLEALLAAAAGQAPASEHRIPAPDDTESSTVDTPLSRRRLPRWLPAAAAVLLAIAVGSVFVGRDDQSGQATSADVADETADQAPALTTTVPPVVDLDSYSAAPPAGPAPATNASAGEAGAGSQASSVPAPQPSAFADSARIVKTGSVEVEVGDGGFQEAVNRVTSLALGLGGYVSDSKSSEQGEAPSGTVTVRVPVGSFEQLLGDVRQLGTVQSVATSGTDVTAQYVDMEARLGALKATRDQLLTVLTQAETIPDILAVQDRINTVQVEIESVEGRRKLLEDQSSLATLTVAVAEPGAEAPTPLGAQDDGGLSGAWDDAKDGFGNAVEWIVARSGTWAVLAIVGLIGYVISRLVFRHYRRAVL